MQSKASNIEHDALKLPTAALLPCLQVQTLCRR
jgi:hypothetical protein